MSHHTPRRSGLAKISILAGVGMAAGVGLIAGFAGRQGDDDDNAVLLHEVQRGDFKAFVTEAGDVASSSNVEVRCHVKGRGGGATEIVKIVDEGTQVKEGDFLAQFNDSDLQNDLLAQKILVANDKSLLIQANSTLDTAVKTLREYTEGLFAQERQVIEKELFVAEETLRRATAHLEYSKRLFARSYITRTQLRADEFAVETAKKDVAATTRKLEVYNKFTKDKFVGQYEADIEKAKANVEAAESTLALSQQKLKEIDEQIAACNVTAPSAGQVVHANDRDRGDQSQVIEEGTFIRYNKVIFRLPDLTQMHVDVKINESHVNQIKAGQPAEIILDADPKNVLRGVVKEVAPYPFPMRWHGAPLEYGAEVTIVDPPPTIRPGLRAKVKIIFDTQPNVIQVPLAAVIEHGKDHYCLVREDGEWQAKQVTVGVNNNNHAVVLSGLDEGDKVSMTPFQYIERSDLPEADVGEDGVLQQVSTSD